MKDSIPPPSPKGTLKKSKLPKVIADENCRVVISSIAAYQEMDKGNINCYLKSGEVVRLDFDVGYLSVKAMAILDAHFSVERPSVDACGVCVRKDKVWEKEAPRTYCDYCYNGKEYFLSPEEDENE